MRYRWFIAGCVVLILMGLAHLAAQHLAPQPPPTNPDEITLVRLMKEYRLELPGAKRSMESLFLGFTNFFTLSSVAMGLAGIAVARIPGAARRVAAIYVLALIAMLINSLVNWFIIPTSFLVVALLLLVICLVPGKSPGTQP